MTRVPVRWKAACRDPQRSLISLMTWKTSIVRGSGGSGRGCYGNCACVEMARWFGTLVLYSLPIFSAPYSLSVWALHLDYYSSLSVLKHFSDPLLFILASLQRTCPHLTFGSLEHSSMLGLLIGWAWTKFVELWLIRAGWEGIPYHNKGERHLANTEEQYFQGKLQFHQKNILSPTITTTSTYTPTRQVLFMLEGALVFKSRPGTPPLGKISLAGILMTSLRWGTKTIIPDCPGFHRMSPKLSPPANLTIVWP